MEKIVLKPSKQLTKEGKKIFKHIIKCIPNHEILINTDSYELSMLANAFDLHLRCITVMNDVTDLKTMKAQVITMWKQTADYITKNSGKFGLSPDAREKLKEVWLKKEKKKSGLAEKMDRDNVSIA